MNRVIFVTGAASGIGAATAKLLTTHGKWAITVDRCYADVIADLALTEGRAAFAYEVIRLSRGAVDRWRGRGQCPRST
jgi:NAD(P)-dependent dehydrogenase (short-subunit alcohol dehydrogenase family)